ncbi:MaoC family dehydratase N-terminal domain-containing protein [Oerskovia sp. NPDC056781]|uniref:FAS1-like dehydratase domain-containing protein n=1 Tax=Oerskovia sp. NPDC056781 TaxID=3345942 RepID=UPI003670182E
MAINADYAGREYPVTAPYSVGREKIREFAAAVGSTHPAHHDVATARGLGYPDLIAPPTFAVIVAQRAEAPFIQDPEARVDFTRVVHADERFVHHRPIVAGDELVTVLHVDSITQRAGISMVTTRAEIGALAADGSGTVEPVATVTSSLVVRGEDA